MVDESKQENTQILKPAKYYPGLLGAFCWSLICAVMPNGILSLLKTISFQIANSIIASFFVNILSATVAFAGIYYLVHRNKAHHYLTRRNILFCALLQLVFDCFMFFGSILPYYILPAIDILQFVGFYVLVYHLTIMPINRKLFIGKRAMLFYGCILLLEILFVIFIYPMQFEFISNFGTSPNTLLGYVDILSGGSMFLSLSTAPFLRGMSVFYLLWNGMTFKQ